MGFGMIASARSCPGLQEKGALSGGMNPALLASLVCSTGSFKGSIMSTATLARALVPLVIVGFVSVPAFAQEWGNKMVDKQEIKFGSVARLADTTFKIKVKNVYQEDIQITSVSTSCGCISWVEASQMPITLQSRQEKELTIRLDTVRHAGEKHVRAYLSFYEPTKRTSATVNIPVEGRIRADFEVRPSYVGFGPIDLGKSYIQRIGINYIGGRPDWSIIQAQTTNPHFTAQIVEKSRAGGSATYEAVVTVDATAPAGAIRDQLVLTTNEGFDSKISIPIEASVEADIVVTDVQFGSVAPGQSKSMNVIVRGKKPFKIEKVDHVTHEVRARATSDGLVSVADSAPASLTDAMTVKVPSTTGQVHTLTLTMTAPAEPGPFEEEFAITIEGRNQPVKFKAKGRIVGQEVTEVK